MNQSVIVAPYLAKARDDLRDAVTPGDYGDAFLAIEALSRAIASVAMAVERLAELVIDD